MNKSEENEFVKKESSTYKGIEFSLADLKHIP